MRSISATEFLSQLSADLIGKDSYRGVTLTYSWIANQFGHFAIGFLLTLFLFPLLEDDASLINPAFSAALCISILCSILEVINLLGPLLNNKSTSTRTYIPSGTPYIFLPKWKNLWFDTITDISYFWFGAFVAAQFLIPTNVVKGILIVLGIILFFFFRYWYRTRIYMQSAKYPFQFRLAQWDKPIDAEDISTVNLFLQKSMAKNRDSGQHLLIFGTNESGKTSLGVGIATELSIKHCDCYYITASKLYSAFSQENCQSSEKNKSLWTCKNCSVLVIDDINPGIPNKPDLVTPTLFLEYLNKQEGNDKWIKCTHVIWILGNEGPDSTTQDRWQEMLKKIHIESSNIQSVRLSGT